MEKILLLEPDQEQEAVFSDWLKGEAYEVKTIDHSKQILRLLYKEKFDILIIDIDFFETTEFSLNLCRILKRNQNFSDFPITVLTYRKNIQIIARSIEAGVDNFILKPFETNSFLNRLETIFKEVKLRSKGKKVLDLNYINYLIKLTTEASREDFFILSSAIFNKLIIDKVRDVLGEPIIAVILKRLRDLIKEDYAFTQEVRLVKGKVVLNGVEKASREIPVEKLSTAFRDYTYSFLQVIQTLTSDILMERG